MFGLRMELHDLFMCVSVWVGWGRKESHKFAIAYFRSFIQALNYQYRILPRNNGKINCIIQIDTPELCTTTTLSVSSNSDVLKCDGIGLVFMKPDSVWSIRSCQ